MTRAKRTGRAALAAALTLALSAAALAQESARELNGFDLSGASIPLEEIRHGGPPRDGIPALVDPKMLPAGNAPWSDDEPVVGVRLGGEARAYPLAVLNWHELVNDTVGGEPLLVSYCPLCGTALVFDRRVRGSQRTFGGSGLLWRSDLLLYDRETESLWSQISARAVSGPARGERLRVLRSTLVPWGRWKREHPQTKVLSPETGHGRDYGTSPYGDYAVSEELYFPVELDERYHPKMPTIGVRLVSGPARAYPAVEIVRAGGRVADRFEGRAIEVAYDPNTQVFDVRAPPEVEVIEGYWFAWAVFHPEGSVFVASD